MDKVLLAVGIVLFALGFVFCAFAGISFRFRALANKPAWGGKTKVFLKIGLPALLAGLVLIGVVIGIQS